MAANQGTIEVENSSNLGSGNLIMEVLKQLVQKNQALVQENQALVQENQALAQKSRILVQEHQALSNKVGVIEVQMDTIRTQMIEMMGVPQTLENGIITEAAAIVNPGGAATILPTSSSAEAVIAVPHSGSGVTHPAHALGGADPHKASLFNTDDGPQGHLPENSRSRGQLHELEKSLKAIEDSGESVENGVKRGKIVYGSTEASHVAGSGAISYSPKIPSQVPYSSTQDRKGQNTQSYERRKPEDFDPIPMSYSDLFDYLVYRDLISFRPIRPLQPPFPKGYDPTATCKFHAGGVGHSVENCKALKHAVQDLIDSKHLSFNDNNVNVSPVKKSREPSAARGQRRSTKFSLIPMSYTDLCSYLINYGLISPRGMKPIKPPFPRWYNAKAVCEFHSGAIGHSTENCKALKQLVQDLIDLKRLTFEKGEGSSSQGPSISKQE